MITNLYGSHSLLSGISITPTEATFIKTWRDKLSVKVVILILQLFNSRNSEAVQAIRVVMQEDLVDRFLAIDAMHLLKPLLSFEQIRRPLFSRCFNNLLTTAGTLSDTPSTPKGDDA